MLLGALTRVFYNLRHQGRTIWALPALGVVGVLLLAWAIKPDDAVSESLRRPLPTRRWRR